MDVQRKYSDAHTDKRAHWDNLEKRSWKISALLQFLWSVHSIIQQITKRLFSSPCFSRIAGNIRQVLYGLPGKINRNRHNWGASSVSSKIFITDVLTTSPRSAASMRGFKNASSSCMAFSSSLLNNHQLKLVGLSYGLEVRIRIDLTMRLCCPQSSVLSNCA